MENCGNLLWYMVIFILLSIQIVNADSKTICQCDADLYSKYKDSIILAFKDTDYVSFQYVQPPFKAGGLTGYTLTIPQGRQKPLFFSIFLLFLVFVVLSPLKVYTNKKLRRGLVVPKS